MCISGLSGLGGCSGLGGNSNYSAGLGDAMQSIFQQMNKKLEQDKKKLETQGNMNKEALNSYDKQVGTEAKSLAPKFAGGQG